MASETKHTPGPWKVFYTTNGQTIIGIGEADGAEGITDPQFGLWRSGPEREANARLIAAAPDMLEALEGIEHFSDAIAFREDHLSKALRQWIEAGRAAIAKATS